MAICDYRTPFERMPKVMVIGDEDNILASLLNLDVAKHILDEKEMKHGEVKGTQTMAGSHTRSEKG